MVYFLYTNVALQVSSYDIKTFTASYTLQLRPHRLCTEDQHLRLMAVRKSERIQQR